MANGFWNIKKGLNLGSQASDPASPLEGDFYTNSTSHSVRVYLNGAWRTLLNDSSGAAVTNLSLDDTTTFLVDTADGTKKLTFDVGGSTGTTTTLTSAPTANRNITLPDATTTLVGTATAQAVSNKTITASTLDSTPVGGTTPAAGTFTATTATNLSINGTAGNGFANFTTQSSVVTTPAAGVSAYVNTTVGGMTFINSANKAFGFVMSNLTAGQIRQYTMPDSNQTIVGQTTTDNLQNKSLFAATCPIVDATDTTKKVAFSVSGNTTGVTLTLAPAQSTAQSLAIPNVASGDALVTKNTTATLTNKTLTDNSTTIADSADATKKILFDAGGTTSTSTTITAAQTASRVVTLPDATTTLAGTDTTQTLTNKSLVDTSTSVVDAVDATKKLLFDAGGTTATTTTIAATQTASRVVTLPDATTTLVGTDTTQTLTGKTLSGNTASNFVNGAATITLPGTTGTLATLANAETLSNKSLVDASTAIVDSTDSTKQIKFDAAGTTNTSTTLTGAQTANRVITLPDATTTVVGTDAAQTLSNKSISDALTLGSIATPTAPGTGIKLYAKADGFLYFRAAGGSESQISTSNLVATSLNTANAIVQRDASGNFAAGTISASILNPDVGAASTPSLYFGTDTTTGLYRRALNSIGVATAGTERAYFTAGGNLIFNESCTVQFGNTAKGQSAITRGTTDGSMYVTGGTGSSNGGQIELYGGGYAIYKFTITAGNATAGATYTNNSQTFTVVNTIAGGTTLQATGTGAPATSGTLTLASGTGDATLTFSAYLAPTPSAIEFRSGASTIGRWVNGTGTLYVGDAAKKDGKVSVFNATNDRIMQVFHDGTTGIVNTTYNSTGGTSGMKFQISNADALTIDTSKNVIVGPGGGMGYTSGAGYGGGIPILQVSPTSTEGAISVGVNDGTTNRRAKLFVDHTNAIWGLFFNWSSAGPAPFVLNMAGTEHMRISTAGAFSVGASGGSQTHTISGNIANFTSSTAGSIQVMPNLSASAGIVRFTNPAASGLFNWQVGAHFNSTNSFEITPSTAVDGSTYNAPVFKVSAAGLVTVGAASGTQTHVVNGSVNLTSNLRVQGLTTAGPVSTDASGNLSSQATLPASQAPLPTSQTKTAAYTALATDTIVIMDCSTTGSFSTTLPSAATGRPIWITRKDASFTAANTATISRAGSDTIVDNGTTATTTTLATQNESVLLIPDGTSSWFVASRNYPRTWSTYAMTWGGTTSAPTLPTSGVTVNIASYRREGAGMWIRYEYKQTATTGSAAGSGTYLFPIPSGFTIDTANMGTLGDDASSIVGTASWKFGTNIYTAKVSILNTTKLILEYMDVTAASNAWTAFASSTSSIAGQANVEFSFLAYVPIAGWN